MKLLKAGVIGAAFVFVVWAGGTIITATLASTKIDEAVSILNKQLSSSLNPEIPVLDKNFAYLSYKRKDRSFFSEKGELLLLNNASTVVEKLPVIINYGFLNAKAQVFLTDKVKKSLSADFRPDFTLESSLFSFKYSVFPQVYDLKVQLGGSYSYTPKENPFSLFFSARLNMFDRASFSFDAKNYETKDGERIGHMYFNSFLRQPLAYKNTAVFSGAIEDFDYAELIYAKNISLDMTLGAPDNKKQADVSYKFEADKLSYPLSNVSMHGSLGKVDLLKLNFLQDAQTIEDFYKILCDNKLNLVLDGLSVVMDTGDPDNASQEKNSFAVLNGKGSMVFNLDDIDKSQGDFEFKLDKMPNDALLSVVFKPFFVTKDNAFYSKIVFSSGRMTVNGKRF